jgi:hypothetical protein
VRGSAIPSVVEVPKCKRDAVHTCLVAVVPGLSASSCSKRDCGQHLA